jgi:NAD(P)-dependent dehydrogenase (short-subunit alcohol dehydrogenase family)
VKACGRVDCVIHLVGGFASGPRVEETTTADIDRMFSLNLHSAWTLARVAMPRFRQQGFGRFAAVASRVVEEPVPLTSAYAASKAALVALMRTLDAEGLEAGIRAKVLLPPTLDANVIREVTGELLEFAAR